MTEDRIGNAAAILSAYAQGRLSADQTRAALLRTGYKPERTLAHWFGHMMRLIDVTTPCGAIVEVES